jgi:Ca-activated chloride channel homolog
VKLRHRRELVLGCLIVCVVPLLSREQRSWAQDCITCTTSALREADTEPWIIRQRVDEVTVFFTVTRGQTYVTELAPEDVTITDDGKPPARTLAFRHQSDLPLRLGVLIDTSDSVEERFDFEKEAASKFLRTIIRPEKDEAFVMGFSDQPTLVQDYTDDPDQMAESIVALNSGGATAIFDAIRSSCEKLAATNDRGPAARILVLLSDGDDNFSTSTLPQAIEMAQRREVTIYTVSTNRSDPLMRGSRVLEQLALETGGRVFFPKDAGTAAKAFLSIEQEMRSRFAVSYQPRDLLLDGRFRHIKIIARRAGKKLRVYARRGYYTPIGNAVGGGKE